MKTIMKICLYAFLATVIMTGCGKEGFVKKNFDYAEKQLAFALEKADSVREVRWAAGDTVVSPRKFEDGKYTMLKATAWTSGFFPGMLWYMYEYTGKDEWKAAAQRYTEYLENEKKNVNTHDTGFKMYCSYGNGYRLTGDPAYKDVLIESAYTLATRFNPNVGCTRSWSWGKWTFPVIIDNMMNLELLFFAARETGDKSLYDMAVSHARTTIKNHFRDDASTNHVVDYNPETGEVIGKCTWQGYDDNTTWSRGQAWAIYGYTMCYRETNLEEFLNQARKAAGFVLNHPSLPEDKVVYWDFNDPAIPDCPRDVSAAAVMASAFYELSVLDPENGKEFKEAADTILNSLYETYKTGYGEKFGFLMDHSTGAKKFERDVPIIYADYYYLEALLRKMNIENK